MELIHITSGLSRNSGGPSVIIPTLCINLKRMGCNVRIVTIKSEFTEAALKCEQEGVLLLSYKGRRICGMPFSKDLSNDLPRIVKTGDIYHVNGLWNYTNYLAYKELVRQKKPFVVSFHGSISNQQFNWGLKHCVAWKILLRRYISKASCLHACTLAEYESIRQSGLNNPVAIIPYAFERWDTLPCDLIHKLIPEMKGYKTLLYLGRIHPNKGIYDLLEAWSRISDFFKDWKLIIAGPGKQDNLDKLLRLIKTKKIETRTSYLGPLYDIKRRAAYQGCNLFVSPSYSENFGLTVGEALSCGKPVIATDGVPWPELSNFNCGWNIRCGISELVSALEEALLKDNKELSEMGLRGQILINKKYSWASVSKNMISVYEWILNGNIIPTCVNIN
jgi:glycosyltransferase involved in cell wall biosynthesis